MARSGQRVRAIAVGVAASALVVLGAGGTLAASAYPPMLYACFDAYGNVRMTDLNTCKLPTGGRLVPINAAGVPGPAGPRGPMGVTGPAGATGLQGIAGVEGPAGATGGTGPAGPTGPTGPASAMYTVESPSNPIILGPNETVAAMVSCNVGDKAISGGWDVMSVSPPSDMTDLVVWRSVERTPGSWWFGVSNADSGYITIRLYATCLIQGA